MVNRKRGVESYWQHAALGNLCWIAPWVSFYHHYEPRWIFFKLKKVWKSVLRGLSVLTYLLLAYLLQREPVHLNNKFMSVDFLPSKSDCQVCVVCARPISTRQLWKSRKNSRSRRAISSYLPTTFSCFQGQWNRLGAWVNAEHLNLYRTPRDYDALLEINCK